MYVPGITDGDKISQKAQMVSYQDEDKHNCSINDSL